ncbi:MAG TPA: cytochrome c biogenesis protein CcdA [Actinomycetes bacterium]|jgi:cytochrome c-type biogenesis protein|nr:cytochrome c biogenesis protein CcdA [Actinomycetes bacterium]
MSAAVVVLAAFLAGLVSFSSPCCLPLLPGYVAYVSGGVDDPDARRTMAAAGLFTLGFGATFTAGYWTQLFTPLIRLFARAGWPPI